MLNREKEVYLSLNSVEEAEKKYEEEAEKKYEELTRF